MPSRRRRWRRPVVVRQRAVVHQAEVEPGRERMRVLGRHAALGGHARVPERVAALQPAQREALDELARRAGLLEDLDRLPGAHHAQLGTVLAQPGLGHLGLGLDDEHRVAPAQLRLAGAELAVQRRADRVPVLARADANSDTFDEPERRGLAVERHARAVRAAIAQLEQHLAEVTAEAAAHVERLGEESSDSTHDEPSSLGSAHVQTHVCRGAQFSGRDVCGSHIVRGRRERIGCGADERQAIHRTRARAKTWSDTSATTTSSSCSRSSWTCTGSRTRSSCRPPTSTACSRTEPGSPGSPPGDIGQEPARPGPRRDAGHPLAHAAARGARTSRGSRATCTWRARSGPTARARSCAASSSARRSMGFEFMLGAELEYFLVRKRDDGTIELADPLDTLDQPCYDMRGLTRNLDFVSMVAKQHHRARVGQLRHRPRGRQRPVRAELRLRRRADHLRPLDLLPLHGRVARPGARHDRDLHAEAVLAPDRQRLPLPHEPLARRRERVRGRPGGRPARHGPVGDRATSSSAG